MDSSFCFSSSNSSSSSSCSSPSDSFSSSANTDSSSSSSSAAPTKKQIVAAQKTKEKKKRSMEQTKKKQSKDEASKKQRVDMEAAEKEVRTLLASGKNNGARRSRLSREYIATLQKSGMITQQFAQQIEKQLDKKEQMAAVSGRALLAKLEHYTGFHLLFDESGNDLQAENAASPPIDDFPFEDSEVEESEKALAAANSMMAMIELMLGGNQDKMHWLLRQFAFEQGIHL